jgi:hypothetical protein
VSEAWVVNASPLILCSASTGSFLIERLVPAILVPNAVIEEVRASPHAPPSRSDLLGEGRGQRRTWPILASLRSYLRSRTHLALAKDTPSPRPVTPPSAGRIVSIPEVGGLHHRYDRIAAQPLHGSVSASYSRP